MCRYNFAGKFEVNAEFPGLGVKYSMDGGHSWSSVPSSLFSASQSATYQFITRSVLAIIIAKRTGFLTLAVYVIG